MGERKVINKYIPADFDPSLIPRGTKLSKKDGTVPVRMMLPFSVQCSTCHTFMYRGRKFNSKKEAMGGPDGRYLGIQRWRFYIKCTHCSRTISFLTDPKNADYEMETGGTRNYEVYKDRDKTNEQSTLEKEEEEKEDPLKALENRVLDSQREMADLDNLEEIKAMNKRHLQVLSSSGDGFDSDAKALLDARERKDRSKYDGSGIGDGRGVGSSSSSNNNKKIELNEDGLTAEDEELVKSIKFGIKRKNKSMLQEFKRLDEEDEKKEEEKRQREVEMLHQQQRRQNQKQQSNDESSSGPGRPLQQGQELQQKKNVIPSFKVKKRRKVQSSTAATSSSTETIKRTKTENKTVVAAAAAATTTKTTTTGLTDLLGGYGSASDSD